jgi:hypothetical protein
MKKTPLCGIKTLIFWGSLEKKFFSTTLFVYPLETIFYKCKIYIWSYCQNEHISKWSWLTSKIFQLFDNFAKASHKKNSVSLSFLFFFSKLRIKQRTCKKKVSSWGCVKVKKKKFKVSVNAIKHGYTFLEHSHLQLPKFFFKIKLVASFVLTFTL